MLIVISTFALDFIHSDRSIFKIVDLDEAWAFLNVAQGETLSNKLVRAGRAMQAGVYFVTQSSGDVAKEMCIRDRITGIILFLLGRGAWKLLITYCKGISKTKNNLSI